MRSIYAYILTCHREIPIMKRRILATILSLACAFAVGFVVGRKNPQTVDGPPPLVTTLSGTIEMRRFTGSDYQATPPMPNLRTYRVVIDGQAHEIRPDRDTSKDRYLIRFADSRVQVFAEVE